MTEMARHPHPHAIMIPLPYQGHISPFIKLAIKLASKGISVTFAHLKLSQNQTTDPFTQTRESGLDIRYTTIPDGFPEEFNRELYFLEHWKSICYDSPGLMDQFVANIIQSSPPHFFNFLVVDPGYLWATTVSKKYNIINVLFSTEPALVFSLGYHWDILKEKTVPGDIVREIDFIPGIKSLSTKDFMSYLTGTEDTLVTETMFKMFTNAKKADFILHNTIEEIESGTLSYLNTYQPNYAIGPINFFQYQSFETESDCSIWLGSKPPGSVLYVSFGSMVRMTKQVIEEIAYGLLLSDVDFIWVVRKDILGAGVNSILPDGYEGQIGNKGLIIPWCNQIQILLNPAVGGFLTHNGWNSTVESMWCGVPMLCFPISFDQPTNRKLVVDEWRVGIDLCDGAAPIDRRGVAQRIKTFMNEEALKREAGRMKETLHNAMEIDGSSDRNFDRFVSDLVAKSEPSINE